MLMQPQQHRFTVRDYHRMIDGGAIPSRARVELVEGLIVDMPPMGPFHIGVTASLSRRLTLLAKDRWLVLPQMSVKISKTTELQPDIMLVTNDEIEFKNRLPNATDVFLIIEVSDSSVRYDRDAKIPIYAKAGIPEVWIVNLDKQRVEIHRDPRSAGYAQVVLVSPGAYASPLAFPKVKIDVKDLLNRAR